MNNIIHEWEDNEYVRKITDPKEMLLRDSYFLPIFVVLRPDKTSTKVRVVCDGRAKFNNKSLNDAILPGPKLMNDLPVVMLRFRRNPKAIIGDIKQMFLRISLAKIDRKYHRFLHRDNPEDDIAEYEFLVHCFGNSGSPAVSVYTIKELAKTHQEEFPRAAECILKSTLVDDHVDSVVTAAEGIQLIKDLKTLFLKIGMFIKKFASNDQEVMNSIPVEDRAPGFEFIEETPFPTLKALGVIWDPNEDILTFKNDAAACDKWTKRQILKNYTRIYDPLGHISPFIIQARIVSQECWREELGWDHLLPKEIGERWQKWLDDLPNLSKVKLTRCIRPF